MKTQAIVKVMAAVILIGLTLQACSDAPTATQTDTFGIEAKGGNSGNGNVAPIQDPITTFLPSCAVGTGSFTLWAGQSTDAGNVVASYADGELTITFVTNGSWELVETHLEVSTSAPSRRGAPGRYANNGNTEDGITYAVAVNEGETVYVLAHAVVQNTITGETETAYGGTIQRGGSWFGVFAFTAFVPECETPTGSCYVKTETAYAGQLQGTSSPWYFNAAYDGSEVTVNITAGRHINIGTATLSDESNGKVTITFNFNAGWGFATVDKDGEAVTEALKIQGYDNEPTKREPSGQFTTHKSNGSTSVTIDSYPFYQIHIDAGQLLACPVNN